MATYFISDIHGEYDLFLKLLKEINFNESDKMYILGDIIDKGNGSIKLLKMISRQFNMFAIKGNHEYHFVEYVKGIINLEKGITDEEFLTKVNEYFPNDNEKISFDEIEFVVNLPYYIENDDFLCVHAGLEIDNEKILPINEQNTNYMVFDRNFKNENFEYIGKPILFGHTPCFYDGGDYSFIKTPRANIASIFSDYKKIRLDTGVQYTNILGVLRKEDMKEIYVKNKKI